MKSDLDKFKEFSLAYRNLLDCIGKELGIYRLLDWIENKKG